MTEEMQVLTAMRKARDIAAIGVMTLAEAVPDSKVYLESAETLADLDHAIKLVEAWV